MADTPNPTGGESPLATRADIDKILGELRGSVALSILALKPTLRDLEVAAVWLEGDGDVLAKSGEPLAGVPNAIYDIVSAEEAEEPPPR